MTNPNPNLPPILCSSIKIPGYKRKLQCPHCNYLYSYFYKYAQLYSITLLLLLLSNVRTTPLRRALILAQAPTPTRRFSQGLFQADRPTSLPLLVFVDKVLEVLQLLLSLLYIVFITLALLLNKVFIAIANLLILQHYLNFVAIARFGSA